MLSTRTIWLLVAVLLASIAIVGTTAVRSVLTSEKPPLTSASSTRSRADGQRTRSAHLELAGSGSNLPLTRQLAAAYNQREESVRVVVRESIGSRGGILATSDGAIDIGLVSRPLRDSELELGLQVVPYARVPVVVAANPTVPVDGLTSADLLALYNGETRQWPDGSRAIVMQREAGDSSHRVFADVLPGFAEVDEASRQAGRFEVLFHDGDMQEHLLAIDGAVGLFDQGAIVSQRLDLKSLAIDGVDPSLATVHSGDYPYVKEFSLVISGEPDGEILAFITFVQSAEGRSLIESLGYLPIGDGP